MTWVHASAWYSLPGVQNAGKLDLFLKSDVLRSLKIFYCFCKCLDRNCVCRHHQPFYVSCRVIDVATLVMQKWLQERWRCIIIPSKLFKILWHKHDSLACFFYPSSSVTMDLTLPLFVIYCKWCKTHFGIQFVQPEHSDWGTSVKIQLESNFKPPRILISKNWIMFCCCADWYANNQIWAGGLNKA